MKHSFYWIQLEYSILFQFLEDFAHFMQLCHQLILNLTISWYSPLLVATESLNYFSFRKCNSWNKFCLCTQLNWNDKHLIWFRSDILSLTFFCPRCPLTPSSIFLFPIISLELIQKSALPIHPGCLCHGSFMENHPWSWLFRRIHGKSWMAHGRAWPHGSSSMILTHDSSMMSHVENFVQSRNFFLLSVFVSCSVSCFWGLP